MISTAEATGDALSFDDLYALYRKRIIAYFRKQGLTQIDAEDNTQEVFLRYWQRHCERTNAIRQPLPYLYAIARHLFAKSLPQEGEPEPPTLVSLDENKHSQLIDEADLLEATDTRTALAEALVNLSEIERKVVLLRHVHGYSREEVARRLGKSVSSVQALEEHALAQLRGILS